MQARNSPKYPSVNGFFLYRNHYSNLMASASKGNGEEKMCFRIPLTISNIFVLYQRAGSIPIKKEKLSLKCIV